jgi:hypothetical protein
MEMVRVCELQGNYLLSVGKRCDNCKTRISGNNNNSEGKGRIVGQCRKEVERQHRCKSYV